MPSMSNIVLEDASAVDHTYSPIRLDGNLGTWRDRSPAVLYLMPTLTSDVRPAARGNGGHKTTSKLTLPFDPPAGSNDCCTPVDQARPANFWRVETMVSDRASETEVDDLIAFLISYVSSDAFKAVVKGESWR